MVFAAMFRYSLLLDDREHFVLTQDQVLLVVDLDFRSGVLADEDAVALLDVQGKLLPLLVDLSLSDGDHLGLHRLLFAAILDESPALLELLSLQPLDENPVVQRANLHACLLSCMLVDARGRAPLAAASEARY